MENNIFSQIPQLYILYASQTGNCESISEDFYESIKDQYSNCKRFLLNDHQVKKYDKVKYDLTKKDSIKVCIFFISSTGNGDFPDNGELFHRFLWKQTGKLSEGYQSKLLSHVYYTILGLGDSNYSSYQGAPRYLDNALKRLGAHKFYEKGEADEATSLELVVEPWLEKVPQAIEDQIKAFKQMSKDEISELLKVDFEFNDDDGTYDSSVKEEQKVISVVQYGQIVNGKHLINQYGSEIIELELHFDKDIPRDLIDVGTSFSIYPLNRQEDIDLILKELKWNGKALIGNNTVEYLLRHEIDIRSEKLKLSKFLSEYDMKFLPDDLKNKPYLTFMDFVSHPNKLEGIEYTIIEDDLPKIKPRHFSIINDPYYNRDTHRIQDLGNTFKICFTVHKFPIGDYLVEGFCTSFLRDLLNQQAKEVKLKCLFTHSNRIIHLPQNQFINEQKPIIMIAHGTGIAPMISILQRIQNLAQNLQPEQKIGNLYLFFGVRNDSQEFLFKNQIYSIFQNTLTKYCDQAHIYLGCSRLEQFEYESQFVTKCKGYVQEFFKLDQVKQVIRESLIDKEGYLMICGNKSTLGNSVIQGLTSGNTIIMSVDELQKLKESGRAMIELWNE